MLDRACKYLVNPFGIGFSIPFRSIVLVGEFSELFVILHILLSIHHLWHAAEAL